MTLFKETLPIHNLTYQNSMARYLLDAEKVTRVWNNIPDIWKDIRKVLKTLQIPI